MINLSSYIFATIFALRSKTASNISHPRPQPRYARYDPPLPLMIFHWAALRIPLNALLGRRPRIVNIKKAIEKVFNCVVYLKPSMRVFIKRPLNKRPFYGFQSGSFLSSSFDSSSSSSSSFGGSSCGRELPRTSG